MEGYEEGEGRFALVLYEQNADGKCEIERQRLIIYKRKSIWK